MQPSWNWKKNVFSLCSVALQLLFFLTSGINGSTRLFNFFPTLLILILEITFILFFQAAVYFIFILLVYLSNPPVYFIFQPYRLFQPSFSQPTQLFQPTFLFWFFPNLPTVIPDSPFVLFSYFLNQSL